MGDVLIPLLRARNREELNVAERFTDASVRLLIETDLALIDAYDARGIKVSGTVLTL